MTVGYSIQEILPEGDIKLTTCFLEAGEGVPAATANIVAG
jgi:hypothetical protein